MRSTIGPKTIIGRQMRSPTITITPNGKATNVGPVVSSVALVRGGGARPGERAGERGRRTIGTKRPISVATPSVVSDHEVFADSPPNVEPLLLATEAKAYVISKSPWKPGLRIELVPAGITRD